MKVNLKELIGKDSTIFFADTLSRFSGYFRSVLKESTFLPDKETTEKLSQFGVALPYIQRQPVYILKDTGAQAGGELISFAQPGDMLIAIGGDELCELIKTAKALDMRALLITCDSAQSCDSLADGVIVFKEDKEVFEVLGEIKTLLSSACVKKSVAPLPIEHCGLSHSSFGKELDEKVFAAYKENGISHMEISFGRYEDTVSLDFKEYKRLADKYGITLWSYHLPFMPFTTLNPAHFDETVRKFTVGYFIELMKEAKADAGISLFVMHGSGEPIHEDDRSQSLKQLGKSLTELAEFADKNGMVIAVENLPRTCLGRDSEDTQKILGLHPSIKMCLDVNHSGSEKAPDIIKRFGSKIVTLHISDYMGKDECHLMPGEGVVDWVATIRSLKAAGYKGPFLYEISRGAEEDGAIWAKEAWHTRLFTRERFLNHKDVKENFDKLMNNAK